MDADPRRVHHLAVDAVVGDVEQPRINVTYCVDTSARSSSGVAVVRFRMNPPLEPSGTITAFFTFWAFIRPSTSVR